MRAHGTAAMDGTADWLNEIPLSLQGGVELLIGADDQPMLYHSERRTYIRLSAAGVRLLRLLDGTRTGAQIAAEVAVRTGTRQPDVSAAVVRFLTDLRNAGVLNVEPETLTGWEKFRTSFQQRPMLKLALATSTPRFLGALAGAVRQVPKPVVAGLLALACGVAVLAIYGVLTRVRVFPDTISWPWAVALYLAHITCHEFAHALTAQVVGVPIREMGVGLLYYFMPVAYVDHTDSYRVRSRLHRAAISLAGPVNDLLFAGLSALVVWFGSGAAQTTAMLLLFFQLSLVIGNLNPLLPTDGYKSLEAAFGQINLRNRAFTYLYHRLTGKPLPSSLAYLKPGQARFYLIYGAVSGLYIAFVAYLIFGSLGRLILMAVAR